MLCAKCHERRATVHYTIVDGDKVTKTDFCEQCAEPLMHKDKAIHLDKLLNFLGSVSEVSGSWSTSMVEGGLSELLDTTTGYPIEAYEFVSEALDFCEGEGCVSGREWLDSIRHLALRKFGKRAKAALKNWKISSTEDFGEIILAARLNCSSTGRSSFASSRESEVVNIINHCSVNDQPFRHGSPGERGILLRG